MPGDFSEWSFATTTFDGTRDTLGQKQPPWDDVPIPCVNNDIHVLIKQITLNDFDITGPVNLNALFDSASLNYLTSRVRIAPPISLPIANRPLVDSFDDAVLEIEDVFGISVAERSNYSVLFRD